MADELRARYKIQLPSGEIIEFEGPGGLSDDQITHLADQYLHDAKPGDTFAPSVYENVNAQGDVGIGDQGFDLNKYNPEDSSAIGAFARGAPQGALLNFADEISAFGNAAIPGLASLDDYMGMSHGDQQAFYDNPEGFWAAVRNNMRGFKEQQQADQALHPTARFAGEIGGAVSTLPYGASAAGKILPTAVKEAMAARPVLTSVGIGGVTGGIGGAGAGQEGTRAQSAAIGTLGGMALAGGISSGMELAPWLATYGRAFFNKLPEKEAVRQIIETLRHGGFDMTSPTGVQKLKSALQDFTGKPVSLADISGSTRARTGVAMSMPSEAQQLGADIISSRTAGQAQRIAQDVRTNVAPRTDVHALDEALVTQRAEEAKRLRDLALFEDVPPSVEPPVQALPEGPEAGLLRTLDPGREAPAIVEPPAPVSTSGRQSRVLDPNSFADDPEKYQKAVELQNLVRLPEAQKALTAALKQSDAEVARLAATGQDISHLPDLTRGSDLDVRTLDTLKRFLDKEVQNLYRRGQTDTFAAGDAANVRALRDEIRDRLKGLVPEYEDYLNQYAGSSEMIDALAEGQKYGRLSPEQIGAEQSRRSGAAQELYRVGAARSILDDLFSTTDTGLPASRVLNSDEARAQLLATGVDPAGAAALNKSVGQERILNLLPQELRSIPSANRALAKSDATVSDDFTIPNPYPLNIMGSVFRDVADKLALRRNEAVNAQLLPRMLETDPKIIGSVIDELEKAGQGQLAATLRRRQQQLRAGYLSGNAIGSPVAIGDQ